MFYSGHSLDIMKLEQESFMKVYKTWIGTWIMCICKWGQTMSTEEVLWPNNMQCIQTITNLM